MLSRRTFFERLSTLPLVGGFLGGTAHSAEAAVPVARDYFKELGVRPFINAAGTFTDMTASLMPPEVMNAINYASKNFVYLNELHDKVGARIAELVRPRRRWCPPARRRR
jgi:D-glucosaminate-6-phosphate ammonia-lyase